MKLFIMSGNGYVCMIPYLVICAADEQDALLLARDHESGYFKSPIIDAELPYIEKERGVLKYWEIHV